MNKEVIIKKVINFSLRYKLPMFIFVMGYIVLFIIQYITKDFDIHKTHNIVKVVLMFLSVFLLGCSCITNNKTSVFFTFTNYIVLFILIIPFIIDLLPEKLKVVESKIDDKITCTGHSELSDNTTINIDYKKDKIKKIVYIYTYDVENTLGAENQVNRFEKMYLDFDNIYSEIDVSDKVVVTLTYDLEHVDMDKLKDIDDTITDSYKKFKKQLSGYKCSKR